MSREIETKKLFYDTYLYKISMYLPLAPIFRGKNFGYARDTLDRLQQDFEAGNPMYRTLYLRRSSVTADELQAAQVLYKILTTTNEEYKLRVDSTWMSIYSNNTRFLDDIMNKVNVTMSEYHRPKPELLDIIKDANTVVVKKHIPHKYRITLGERTDQGFVRWAETNLDKIKITDYTLNSIRQNCWTKGLYFYARDEKIIQLLTLILGNSIRRVDKVVCTEDLDK